MAYLIRCGQFHVKGLCLWKEWIDYDGRSMGDDPQDVGAIDALTFLLGLEGGSSWLVSLSRGLISLTFSDKEPGLSVCQWNDLRLNDTDANYYGDTIGGVSELLSHKTHLFIFLHLSGGLNWLLALRSKRCKVRLHESLPTAKSGEVPR
jgi:hypothetical protein